MHYLAFDSLSFIMLTAGTLQSTGGKVESLPSITSDIKKRRRHKRAITAVARMILACLYHIFLKKEAFLPSSVA